MHHGSAGLWRLMSELWISFQAFSFQYQASQNAANDVCTHALRIVTRTYGNDRWNKADIESKGEIS